MFCELDCSKFQKLNLLSVVNITNANSVFLNVVVPNLNSAIFWKDWSVVLVVMWPDISCFIPSDLQTRRIVEIDVWSGITFFCCDSSVCVVSVGLDFLVPWTVDMSVITFLNLVSAGADCYWLMAPLQLLRSKLSSGGADSSVLCLPLCLGLPLVAS